MAQYFNIGQSLSITIHGSNIMTGIKGAE